MKKAITPFAGLTISILALAGCGTVDESKEDAARAHAEIHQKYTGYGTDPEEDVKLDSEPDEAEFPTPDSTETDDGTAYQNPQEWADARAEQYRANFLTTYSNVCNGQVELHGGCGLEDPHSHISDISATEVGYLVVTLDEGEWSTGWAAGFPAEYLAGGMMTFIAYDAQDVEQITVELPGGGTFTKEWDPGQYKGYYGQEVRPATR